MLNRSQWMIPTDVQLPRFNKWKTGESMGISEIIGKGSTLAVCAALGLSLAGCGGNAAEAKSGSTPTKAVAVKTAKKSKSRIS